jgi:hypothetical protein
MIEVKAPYPYKILGPSIFLGGSIEMDTAEKWQDKIVEALTGYYVTILNPRRDNWNTLIKQSISDPDFSEQVNWELNALDAASIIIFYFDPNTLAPITLMELGLMVGKGKKNILVCCPDGYWRKGNVEILCNREGILSFNTFDELVDYLKRNHVFNG